MSEDLAEKLFVGVITNPDGTRDYSKALEMKRADPVIDRLTGSLIINQEREERYKRFQENLLRHTPVGRRIWFMNTINEVKPDKNQPLDFNQTSSLQFFTNTELTRELEEQYKHRFDRPVFVLSLAELKQSFHTFSGSYASSGFVLLGGKLEEQELTRGIGITVTGGSLDDTIHEILHTIDPYLNARPEKDMMLEEFAAYYRETYTPRVYVSTTRHSSGKEEIQRREVFETPKRIGLKLKVDEHYVQNYSRYFDSMEDYKAKIDSVVETINELEQLMDKKDINRALFNSKTQEELQHLVDVLKRRKKED